MDTTDATVPWETFDAAYAEGWAGWVLDGPQPAFVELLDDGAFHGSVLDAGCGTGLHTIMLAERGYDAYGIDFTERAIALARANAEQRGVDVRFEVADALTLAGADRFDTVIDSALFHVFGAEDRRRYADALHRVCRPSATVHVVALALTDAPGFGPRITDTAIRTAFADGWQLQRLDTNVYRAVVHDAEQAAELSVTPEEAGAAEALQLSVGDTVDLPAWLATFRRI